MIKVQFRVFFSFQVDLFFYREPEEAKEREDEEGVAPEFTPAEYAAPMAISAEQWTGDGALAGNWDAALPPIAGVVPVPAQELSEGNYLLIFIFQWK